MAEVTVRNEINVDEHTYWTTCVFDPEFNRKLYVEALKFPEWRVLETREDESTIWRRVQVQPPSGSMPGPVKKVLGDALSYIEEGTFNKKTKRYSFKVIPSTLAEKTSIHGEMWVEPLGDKKVARVTKMTVEVKVFMVGGMIEEMVISDLRSSYEKGTTFTNTYFKPQA